MGPVGCFSLVLLVTVLACGMMLFAHVNSW